MELANLKRWQWACIGVVLGLAVSLWRGWVGPEGDLVDRPTLESVDFERLVLEKDPSGQPAVKNIRLHSQVDNTTWLTAEQLLRPSKKSSERYVAVKIPAKTPFAPKTNPPAKVDPNYTVIDWLSAQRAKNPQIGYSTRWWAQEPMRTPLFAVAGLVLFAGVFPSLIGVLTGQGINPKRDEEKKDPKKPEYDLSRFGKGKAEPTHKPAARQITEQDLQHVRELDDELERRLSGTFVPSADSTSTDSPTATGSANKPDQPVQKLSGGPLEASTDDKPKKMKRFGGEFYPTETHVKQEDEQDKKK